MSKLVVALVMVASLRAQAEPIARVGAMAGVQRTDRSAWVFGPSLEVTVAKELAIRGEAQLELGDFDDPFGPSNIRSGSGPHVNHILFGPTWRPARYTPFALAAGAEVGILVMHSVFADSEFTEKPAAGLFVQAGRTLGPVAAVLQIRVDVSPTIAMGGQDGDDVPTTCARFNLAFEVPIGVR